jgi:tetratricopeptide (TPR) repeat protein
MTHPAYYSKLFRDFRHLDAGVYRDVIHFVEAREDELRRLDFDEYFEVFHTYANALFEVGYYRQYLLVADELIEAVIQHNIRYYRQEDVYRKLLFRKAASLYNTAAYEAAASILSALIRMDRQDKDAARFLEKCYRTMYFSRLQLFRATGILLLLLSALVISVEVLFIRPFYTVYVNQVELLRIGMFLSSCGIMLTGEVWHRYWAYRKVAALRSS